MAFSRLQLLAAVGVSGGVHLAVLGVLGSMAAEVTTPLPEPAMVVMLPAPPLGPVEAAVSLVPASEASPATSPSKGSTATAPSQRPRTVTPSLPAQPDKPAIVDKPRSLTQQPPDETVAAPQPLELPNPMTAGELAAAPVATASLTALHPAAIDTVATARSEAVMMTQVRYRQPPQPVYPAQSRRLGEQGEVRLKVRVDVQGMPAGIEILESSGSARLDQAAVQAVEAARFEPLTVNGVPTAALAIVPIRYELR